MQGYDEVTLLGDTAAPRGVHDEPQETARTVDCEVKSVGRREAYEAMNAGHRAEWVLEIAQADDYHGEEQLLFRGTRYNILRTYETEHDSIELVIEKAKE